MGLQYGYDEIKGKWYAKGLWFIRYYDTEAEMKADSYNATMAYFEKRRSYHDIAMCFAQLRYAR